MTTDSRGEQKAVNERPISWRDLSDACQMCQQPLDAHDNPWDCEGQDPGAESWLLMQAYKEAGL